MGSTFFFCILETRAHILKTKSKICHLEFGNPYPNPLPSYPV